MLGFSTLRLFTNAPKSHAITLSGAVWGWCCLTFLLMTSVPASAIELLTASQVGSDIKKETVKFGAINGNSLQLDILITHEGWQYTAYYNGQSPRRIVMARRNRQVPASPWETFVFQDYTQNTDDGHNVIVLGICTVDGTLHLAFDHHNDDLNYRRSVVGLLSNPGAKPWNASQFGPITDKLGSEKLSDVTYPLFTTSPSGKLFFSRRIGGTGEGDQILYEYSSSAWKTIGKFIEGAGASAYVDNLVFGQNGRLHAGWIWRQGGLETAHDICYAYSDDDGRTWFNSAGVQAGTIGDGALKRNFPGIAAIPIAKGQMRNHEGMTVDLKNRPHFVHRLGDMLHHFYRGEDGAWHKTNTGIKTGLDYDDRKKILTDAVHNAYILVKGHEIAMATEAAGYQDWKIVYTHPRKYTGTALFDRHLLAQENILSLYVIDENHKSVEVNDFKLPGSLSTSIKPVLPVRNSSPWFTEWGFSHEINGRRVPTGKSGIAAKGR